MYVTKGESREVLAFYIGKDRFEGETAAIKAVRERTGCELLVAKLAVEAFQHNGSGHCRQWYENVPSYEYHEWTGPISREVALTCIGEPSTDRADKEEALRVLEQLAISER